MLFTGKIAQNSLNYILYIADPSPETATPVMGDSSAMDRLRRDGQGLRRETCDFDLDLDAAGFPDRGDPECRGPGDEAEPRRAKETAGAGEPYRSGMEGEGSEIAPLVQESDQDAGRVPLPAGKIGKMACVGGNVQAGGKRVGAIGFAENFASDEDAGEFDGVVTADVICQVENPAVAVAELFRVLRPGGVVVINLPAYMWMWSYHDDAVQSKHRYTRAELRSLLVDAGF